MSTEYKMSYLKLEILKAREIPFGPAPEKPPKRRTRLPSFSPSTAPTRPHHKLKDLS